MQNGVIMEAANRSTERGDTAQRRVLAVLSPLFPAGSREEREIERGIKAPVPIESWDQQREKLEMVRRIKATGKNRGTAHLSLAA
jgi:hypothetical protein